VLMLAVPAVSTPGPVSEPPVAPPRDDPRPEPATPGPFEDDDSREARTHAAARPFRVRILDLRGRPRSDVRACRTDGAGEVRWTDSSGCAEGDRLGR
jgi:hypothetical protein